MGELSDEEFMAVIAKGRGAMPGFAALVKPEELRVVAAYARSLSSDKSQR